MCTVQRARVAFAPSLLSGIACVHGVLHRTRPGGGKRRAVAVPFVRRHLRTVGSTGVLSLLCLFRHCVRRFYRWMTDRSEDSTPCGTLTGCRCIRSEWQCLSRLSATLHQTVARVGIRSCRTLVWYGVHARRARWGARWRRATRTSPASRWTTTTSTVEGKFCFVDWVLYVVYNFLPLGPKYGICSIVVLA